MQVLTLRAPRVVRCAVYGLFLAITACESSSTNVTAPSAAKCGVTATNTAGEIPPSGGSGTISVTASRDCTWSASAQTSWISLSQTSGQGSATVNYSVQPNPAGVMRKSGVTIEQQAVDIVQAAAPCRYQAAPSTVAVDQASHQLSIAITATDACQWSARPDAAWITVIAPADGTGNGAVRLTVAANTGDSRTGTIAIGAANVTINQAAPPPPAPPVPAPDPTPPPTPPPAPTPPAPTPTPAPTPPPPAPTPTPTPPPPTPTPAPPAPTPTPAPTPPPPAPTPTPTCTYTLANATADLSAAAQDLSDSVTAPAGCAWTVSSDAPWITIADGRSGSGNGSFRLSIAVNSGAARTGTVKVGTAALTVHQAAAACTPTIKPTDYDAGRGPDRISVSVTAGAWCAWTTTTNATWVTITAGSSGTGNGTVQLSIPANTGPARTTVVSIAGNAFSLRQEAGCDMSIKPTWYDAGRGPDTITIAVTADPGCTWTAASTVSWVSVTQGSTGSGSGTVVLSVTANDGPARSATLTIAGQPFALTQHGSK